MLFNWTDNDFWEFGSSSSASLYQKRMNRQHLWSHLSAEGVCCCSLLYTCSGVYISLNCVGFGYKTLCKFILKYFLIIQVCCCFWSTGWILQHWLRSFNWNCMNPHPEICLMVIMMNSSADFYLKWLLIHNQ